MPPYIERANLQEHRMTGVHAIVILDDDEQDPLANYQANRQESTSLRSLPPAFNPEFVGASSQKPPATPAMAPITMQTADQVAAVNSTTQASASEPVTAETVHPFIAAVFQCGFEDLQVEEEEKEQEFGPRSCLDENILAERTIVSPNDRLEKRFVQEPRRHKAAAGDNGSIAISTARSMEDAVIDLTNEADDVAAAASGSSTTSALSSAMSSATLVPALIPAVTGHEVPRDGTKANPPSAPRYIPLTQHQSHYDRLKPYARLLAWRTQIYTKAALERGIRMHQKHAPTVKRMAKKSWKAVRKASGKTIAFAGHHGPIVGRKLKRASIRGYETAREYEAEHQLLANTKSGIYNVWRRQRGTRAEF